MRRIDDIELVKMGLHEQSRPTSWNDRVTWKLISKRLADTNWRWTPLVPW